MKHERKMIPYSDDSISLYKQTEIFITFLLNIPVHNLKIEREKKISHGGQNVSNLVCNLGHQILKCSKAIASIFIQAAQIKKWP